MRDSDTSLPGPHGDQKRGLVGITLTWLLGPFYYWTDMYDANRRLNHGKIIATLVLVVLLAMDVYIGHHVFGPDGDADKSHQSELWAFVVLSVLLVFASYGLPGLKVWASTKGGGTVDAASAVAQAETAARRALTGGDHEPAP